MDEDEDLYRASHGRLFGIAYRLLGSAAEAEDVVCWSTNGLRAPGSFT